MDIQSFFNPKNIAVVGVSSDLEKLGSIVFRNIIDAGYQGELIGINPKLADQKLLDKQCFASVTDYNQLLDLVVVVIPAKFVSAVIDDCVQNKAKNVSVITAGFSEVGNHELEQEILKKCKDNGISLLGPNCLGHISTYNNLNASFADGFPDRGRIAFISQSGAICSAMMDWARAKGIGFSHFISIGNKADLSEVTLFEAIKNDPNTDCFVFYLESLSNGQEFLKNIKEVAKTKHVIVLEPGKSAKAAEVSLSHTGSLAPNYRVLQTAYQEAGVIQVYSLGEMFGLLEILQFSRNKDFGNKLTIVTNAGGVGVLVSDLCEEAGLELPIPSETTVEKLKNILPGEAALKNPVDLVGDAKADRYQNTLDILCGDKEVKDILVLLTPQRITEVSQTAEVIANISQKTNKNIFASFIGGVKTKEGIDILTSNNIIHFSYPAEGIKLLGLLKQQQEQKARIIADKIEIGKADERIVTIVNKAIEDKLLSLPQNGVQAIMEYYKLDYPKSGNFTDKNEALVFCQRFFPNKVVLKLSAPEALHKTEMKGIYLNINDEQSFNSAWNELWQTIDNNNIVSASILIQEQIASCVEVILGVNSDEQFGKVMLFGSGGIYTEIYQDTALTILPSNNIERLITQTKIGQILSGVRGEKPKAINALFKTIKQVQRIALELPQIRSIDINPIFMTDERAVVVDFKIIL